MKITNINQLLPFVEKKPEFIVMDKGDFTVIDYVYQDNDTFDYPELQECRGIKFDKNGLIIARPFRKFFNYGERGSDLPAHRPHIITEKLDGSMVHPVLVDRKLFLHTRKGHTDVARKAEQFALRHSERDYVGFCQAAIKEGWTPIFEYVGPNNRIVLRYDEESLVLLVLRNIVDGHFMNRLDMLASARSFNVPLVDSPDLDHNNSPLVDVNAFVKHTRELEDAEGYVVYFDDGYMVKIKAEDYVLKHRALDDLSSKKKVVALCCQGFMDDVLPILSEADQNELLAFNHDLQKAVNIISGTATTLGQRVLRGDMTRKDFALNVAPTVMPPWIVGLAFGVMDGKDARMLTLKAVERGGYESIDVKWRGE